MINLDLNVVIIAFDFFETLNVTLQILNNIKFVKIIVYITNNSLNESQIKILENEFNVRVVNLHNVFFQNFPDREAYCVRVLTHFYENNYHLTSKHTLFINQDIWLLDYMKFVNFFKKYDQENYDGMFYYTRVDGDLGTDLFVFNNDGKVLDLIKHEEFLNIKSGMAGQFEKIFGNFITKNFNMFICNKNTLISHYGYSSLLGKVHVHFYKQKLHYINLYETTYNKKLNFNHYRLLKENARPTSEDEPHMKFVDSFDEDGATLLYKLCQIKLN